MAPLHPTLSLMADLPLSTSFLLCLQEFIDTFAALESGSIPPKDPLSKLCIYCEELLQEEEVIAPILRELQKLKIEMRWSKKERTNLLQKMRKKLSDLFEALTPLFSTSCTDENVLFFLLEKREQLNHFLGQRTVEKLLFSLFPEGKEKLRSVICEGYARRGFASFFTQHKPLIDALEWVE